LIDDDKPETCGPTDGGVMRPAPNTRSGDRRGHETRAEQALLKWFTLALYRYIVFESGGGDRKRTKLIRFSKSLLASETGP
jgi:hypothetical protein